MVPSNMMVPISALPHLSPWSLRLRRPRSRFPFDSSELTLTYLGRNAVFRAAHALGLVGHEVIVPAYHHGVEVEALLAAGVNVRFARVDEHMRLDLDDVEAQLQPQTRGLYVIHYLGFPQPLHPLKRLARERGLSLIEDCALSLFSRDGDVPLGSVGDAAVFCFYKTVPVAHGGGLWVKRPRRHLLAKPRRPPFLPALSHLVGSILQAMERRGRMGARLRAALRRFLGGLREQARQHDVPVGTQTLEVEAVDLGMHPLMQRVLRSVDAEKVVERRRRNWLALHTHLAEPGRAVFDSLAPGVCPLFYPLWVDDKDRALSFLRAHGIEAIDFWRRGHPAANERRFPEVEALRHHVLELPCHQDLTPDDLAHITQVAARAATL